MTIKWTFDVFGLRVYFIQQTDSDLQQSANTVHIKWRVVAFSHPAYTCFASHCSVASLTDPYHPLFDQYKVDLVCSHIIIIIKEHFPAHTTLHKLNPIVFITSFYDYVDTRGQIHLVVGTERQYGFFFGFQAILC